VEITQNVKRILSELPAGIRLVAAVKTRTADEVREAVAAGLLHIGHNYVQEAESMRLALADIPVKWHCLGHLQSNKVKKAVLLFDMIETVDSVDLAKEIDKRSLAAGKVMDILIEVNSGREPQKAGAMPEDVPALVDAIAPLKNVRLCGLMTMGRLFCGLEQIRPCFKLTKQLFDALPVQYRQCLSMGMSDSYKAAIEEGATMVRIGTALFGSRNVLGQIVSAGINALKESCG
jgi:pyridoxal phosphate enzyme (YggS family)